MIIKTWVSEPIKDGLLEHISLVSSLDEADTVIIALTEQNYAEWFGDTTMPSLITGMAHPENQAALNLAIEAKEAGKNVIGLLVSGRPLVLGNYLDVFDQFVAMFLPGPEGGSAIAALLDHDVPFTGKLSFYWPSSINHLTYDQMINTHLFEIGYGLETSKKSDS